MIYEGKVESFTPDALKDPDAFARAVEILGRPVAERIRDSVPGENGFYTVGEVQAGTVTLTSGALMVAPHHCEPPEALAENIGASWECACGESFTLRPRSIDDALEAIRSLRARAEKAEGLLSSTREALAYCEKLHEEACAKAIAQCERAEKAEAERDALAYVEKLHEEACAELGAQRVRAEKSEAELGRLRSELRGSSGRADRLGVECNSALSRAEKAEAAAERLRSLVTALQDNGNDRASAYGVAMSELGDLRARVKAAEEYSIHANDRIAKLAGENVELIAESHQLRDRAEKAEAERDRARARGKALCDDVYQLRAELERAKAECVWSTPEDRQG